jgi:hypothetical protein
MDVLTKNLKEGLRIKGRAFTNRVTRQQRPALLGVFLHAMTGIQGQAKGVDMTPEAKARQFIDSRLEATGIRVERTVQALAHGPRGRRAQEVP